MKYIDAHVHIFRCVHGGNSFGSVISERCGRVENGGVLKPFIPPLSADTSFSAEQLLAYMDDAGVERALLLQNPTIGDENAVIASAVRRWSERFAGTVQADPFDPRAPEIVEAHLAAAPFRALKLELSDDWGWLSIHHDTPFSFPLLYPLLDTARARGLCVVIDPGSTNGRAYQPEAFRELARRYPDVRFLIEHLGYWTPDGDETNYQAMLSVGKEDNVWFGLSAVATLLQDPYPCENALRLVKNALDLLGPDKLLWGTDAPTTLNGYTYRQLRDMFLNAPFLNDGVLEKLMYQNALGMFFA